MALWSRKSNSGSGERPIDPPKTIAPKTEPPETITAQNAHEPLRSNDSSPMSDEQKRHMGEASKRLVAAFGEIVSLLMRTPDYKNRPIGDLEFLVVPAVAAGQFTLAEAQLKANGLIQPMGAILWARVSDDVDRRLTADPSQPIRLNAAEWTSGEHIWLVEAVGEARVVQVMLQRMAGSVWKDRHVKLRARGKDGAMMIATLPTPPHPM
jgi:hemolysin-activating ACP:hemolysin acyltransferase